MNIRWSKRASSSFNKCADYIAEKSSDEIAEKWKNEVFKSLSTLKIFPEAGRKVGKNRIWLPRKNYKVRYEIRNDIVYIILFRHAKRKPLRYG